MVTNKNDQEILKESYISPEEKKIIDNLSSVRVVSKNNI